MSVVTAKPKRMSWMTGATKMGMSILLSRKDGQYEEKKLHDEERIKRIRAPGLLKRIEG
jgi:hypothetical protein